MFTALKLAFMGHFPAVRDLIKKLKAAAKKSDTILLATDPDREGEAISWSRTRRACWASTSCISILRGCSMPFFTPFLVISVKIMRLSLVTSSEHRFINNI